MNGEYKGGYVKTGDLSRKPDPSKNVKRLLRFAKTIFMLIPQRMPHFRSVLQLPIR